MRVGFQVMSACLVDVSIAGRVTIVQSYYNSNKTGNRHINKARRHNLNTHTHAVITPNIDY